MSGPYRPRHGTPPLPKDVCPLCRKPGTMGAMVNESGIVRQDCKVCGFSRYFSARQPRALRQT